MKAYVNTIENHDNSEAAAHRCIKSGLKNGIKIEKFYAVTPKDNPKQIFKDRGYPLEYFTEEFSKSENTTSTFLSHLFLWEKAVKLNSAPSLSGKMLISILFVSLVSPDSWFAISGSVSILLKSSFTCSEDTGPGL